MPFEKGVSGNPAGKPRGAKNKRTVIRQAVQNIFGTESAFWEFLAQQSKDGDMQASRIVAERLIPALKAILPAVEFDLDESTSPTDMARQILAGVADGSISPDIGTNLINALSGLCRISEIDELERRLSELEQAK